MVQFYNHTKSGVDILDSMLRLYSTKASTRRWPVAIFYDMLDKAAINSWILYKQTTGEKITRREFIIKLVKELCLDNSNEIIIEHNKERDLKQRKRKACSAIKCRNKSFKSCDSCNLVYCGKHLSEMTSLTCGKCTKLN